LTKDQIPPFYDIPGSTYQRRLTQSFEWSIKTSWRIF